MTKMIGLAGNTVLVSDSPAYADFWSTVDKGAWELHTLHAIERLLKPGSTYIDIGAWIGPTVLKAAQTAGRVIAYEPDPVAGAELRVNIELNRMTHVEIRPVALFDQDGMMKFGGGYANELGKSVSSLMYGERGIDVVVRDVGDEVRLPEFSECSLLKIDVEGAEYRLIRRMGPFLLQVRPSLLLSTHSRKITGRPGLRGMLDQMSDLFSLVKTLRLYDHIYIESRRGWKKFSGFRQLKFLLSVNSNRQILATTAAINELA